MSSTFIIALIAAVIIGSFVVSAISYSRQQALKKKNQLVKRYQQQADEALAYISILLQIDERFDLIQQLQNLVVNALASAAKLNPDNQQIVSHLHTQKTKLSEYINKQRPTPATCWVTSDAELANTQSQLAQLSKLFDLYRNKGALNQAKHQELQLQIQNLQNDLSINSYLYQADCFAEQNNITPYQLYMKKAIQVIKKSSIDIKIKNQKVKHLSELIQQVRSTGKANALPPLIKKPAATEDDEALMLTDSEI